MAVDNRKHFFFGCGLVKNAPLEKKIQQVLKLYTVKIGMREA